LLGTLCAAHASAADDVADLLASAGRLAAQQDVLGADALMRQAMAELWSQGPMGFRQATLVSQQAEGFGMEVPRADSSFGANEPILVYAEPVGYRFVRSEGAYEFGFSADFAVLSEDMEVLAGQRDYQSWRFRSRYPLFEVYLNLSYTLDGAPPGNYIIETELHDLYSDRSTNVRLPVTVR
jgi:hypothetical protein